MASQDVRVRIERVNEALAEKGIEDVYATHYDNAPVSLMVLHDDHGRLAHCDVDTLIGIIAGSCDVEGLWAALEHSGKIRTATMSRA